MRDFCIPSSSYSGLLHKAEPDVCRDRTSNGISAYMYISHMFITFCLKNTFIDVSHYKLICNPVYQDFTLI